MSGKQHKRELKREREAQREAARKAERRRTMITLGIIAALVALGGVLIVASLEETDDVADTDDGRPVACGAQAPPNAGQEKATYTEPEQVLEEGVDYRATVVTSCGTVVMDLYEDRAPQTVNSFVFLAEQGFFDGLEIFRNATTIGALQTGAGTNEATWDLGYFVPGELEAAEAEGYPPGSVAMANPNDPDRAGSQFFFVYNDQFALPPTYTKFAQVTEGLEVLETIGAIEAAGAQGETPQERVYMESVTIERAPAGEGEDPASDPAATPTSDPAATPTTDPAATPGPTPDEPATDPTASPSPTS